MTSELDQKLYKYLFPVTDHKVFVEAEDKSVVLAPHYKAMENLFLFRTILIRLSTMLKSLNP